MKPVLVLALMLVMPTMTARAQEAAPDSQLCRSQLDLLISGNKLTEDEARLFEDQCNCLEAREQGDEAAARDHCPS